MLDKWLKRSDNGRYIAVLLTSKKPELHVPSRGLIAARGVMTTGPVDRIMYLGSVEIEVYVVEDQVGKYKILYVPERDGEGVHELLTE